MLINACESLLSQLTAVVEQLSDKEFITPSFTLSNATIGQHIRHTIEFFICLEEGYNKGIVNYDKRARNTQIEMDKSYALAKLSEALNFVRNIERDRSLRLEVGYDLLHDDCISIETNYFRELTYNIEHAVHHMALIKIGIKELAGHVALPHDFGVASSTIRHRDHSAVRVG